MAKASLRNKSGDALGGMLTLVEWLCNLFIFVLPLLLALWSAYLWLKSGHTHWVASKEAIGLLKLQMPAKLTTQWAGLNNLYGRSLNAPLVLVSIAFGLVWIFFGAVLGVIRKRCY